MHDKTILILSPQAWGTMFLSKHHYALALAKRGNRVYFLNPPTVRSVQSSVQAITRRQVEQGLYVIDHVLFFPYRLKFHFMPVFHWFMRFQVKRIVKSIPQSIDIVWSFDLGNLYPFKFFQNVKYKIFHPVDEPLNSAALVSAIGADIMFSVTREILLKYSHLKIKEHFMNHGLAADFLEPLNVVKQPSNALRVGISGNLLLSEIDRETLLLIIEENQHAIFEFWGSYDISQSNIGGSTDPETLRFIDQLTSKRNVILHGPVNVRTLATALHSVDVFLICYDVQRGQSKGTNSHKVMEYLSTGKVIVANNISTYAELPGLIKMVDDRTNNRKLPGLFQNVIRNLEFHNSAELQGRRVTYASENSYVNQINRIEEVLCSL